MTDLRRGFTGLSTLVQTKLEQAPFSGHVFVLRGRRGDLIKLLFDGDGVVESTFRPVTQRARLGNGFFHRQHTDDVIPDAEMIAFRFYVRVHYLRVEKLRGLRLASNAPVVIIQQPAEEPELSLDF